MHARCLPGSSDASRARAVPRASGPVLARTIGNRAMARLVSGRAEVPPGRRNASAGIPGTEPLGHGLAAAIGNRAMARLASGPGSVSPRRPKAPTRILARDRIKEHPVAGGTFSLHLTTRRVPGAKSGLEGTITFMPDADAPDSTRIRLFQAARQVNTET